MLKNSCALVVLSALAIVNPATAGGKLDRIDNDFDQAVAVYARHVDDCVSRLMVIQVSSVEFHAALTPASAEANGLKESNQVTLSYVASAQEYNACTGELSQPTGAGRVLDYNAQTAPDGTESIFSDQCISFWSAPPNFAEEYDQADCKSGKWAKLKNRVVTLKDTQAGGVIQLDLKIQDLAQPAIFTGSTRIKKAIAKMRENGTKTTLALANAIEGRSIGRVDSRFAKVTGTFKVNGADLLAGPWDESYAFSVMDHARYSINLLQEPSSLFEEQKVRAQEATYLALPFLPSF